MTLPASSSINSYGSGVLVDAVPLVDPTSEMGAAALNPLRNDLSAMTYTAIRCLFQFTAVSSGNPAITSTATWTAGNDSNWGNAFATQPTMVRTGTGAITVTMPASVSDQLGNTNLVNIRAAKCSIMSGTTAGFAICAITSSSTFTIKLFNTSGSAADFASTLFLVECF